MELEENIPRWKTIRPGYKKKLLQRYIMEDCKDNFDEEIFRKNNMFLNTLEINDDDIIIETIIKDNKNDYRIKEIKIIDKNDNGLFINKNKKNYKKSNLKKLIFG